MGASRVASSLAQEASRPTARLGFRGCERMPPADSRWVDLKGEVYPWPPSGSCT